MSLSRIYSIIAKAKHPIVDRAIADALPTADPAAAERLVALMLERSGDRALSGLVRHFASLPKPQKRDVIGRAGALEHVLRRAGRSDDMDTRLNAIEIIESSSIATYAYLLVSQLHADDPTVIRRAARALLTLANDAMVPTSQRAHEPADGLPPARRAELLVTAVTDACTFFHRHRRRDVLLAAAALVPTRDPRLLATLGNRHVPSFGAMVELIRQADHPLICRAMLILATEKGLSAAVTEGLDRTHTAANTLELLRQGHLLQLAEARQAIARVRRSERLLPTYQRLQQLDAEELRSMPRWIATLDVEPEAAAEALGHVAALASDPVTRLLALRALKRTAHNDALRLVGAMCFDGDVMVAARALKHLVQSRWDGLLGLMVRLVSSNNPLVQRMTESQLAPVGFSRVWQAWNGMSHESRLAAGRALIKIDGLFHHRLAARLAEDHAERRLQALSMVRTLRQETYFEDQLLALSQDADARVASSAVKAVAAVGDSPEALAALRQALSHRDDRVRSNAIESLEQLKHIGEVRQMLFEIAGGRGNRSRATAIKALLDMPQTHATDVLTDMLGDSDRKHRVSALWVVENAGVLKLVDQVADVAKADPQQDVRRRALRVLRHMAATHGLARAG